MKRILLALTLGSSFLILTPAHATGNNLLSQCSSAIKYIDEDKGSDLFGIGYCFGFVSGIRNSISLLTYVHPDSSLKACIPQEVTNLQTARVVLNFLQKNPDKLHEEAFVLSVAALKEAFPCNT